ncbi:MAG TPA: hypothetical protein VF157_03210 [Chloroflexota bacterium]
MTQAQLLAIDTILPTILGCAGLALLVAALWPLGRAERVLVSRTLSLGLVGAASLGLGVWLWLTVINQGSLAAAPVAVPTLSASPVAKPTLTAPSASPSASPASVSAPASAAPAATTAAPVSSAPAAASPAATAVSATPTIPPNLTPVAAVPFQPENTPPHTAIIGVESFEHGSMLYRDDQKQIYVMTFDQKFKVYPDTWKEGVNPDLVAPNNGKFVPGRGFGWLWASDADVRQALGLALTPEAGFTGSISGDGTSTTIRADATYTFNKDGTWALK